ncbi:uncharacterized protein SCHCODRAFT_02630112 [Schizophyllum commune H4-8]|uniref:uncharacterized protein n=1 Tax=Schizophyllum commune (strain H4-8 / FGSC 9210) TaxID=578458 RepID=UPI0021601884|nr:uncharacterized protein SCHCODRAFT_02646094 [Schizophyllum commune H4-8]XP_050199817.1 uncharacterized protein SCHCODRAFT_02630112 [Schizophyllum commune H4-8]KAI5836575.1 hypothetical protein SCHCODRAFT_02646094 [Schizophyllum commune H4-8]KAI5891823.1 hypothetical protein SCHCODRAFT_02630112 [Schizophyllum commune H4-8]
MCMYLLDVTPLAYISPEQLNFLLHTRLCATFGSTFTQSNSGRIRARHSYSPSCASLFNSLTPLSAHSRDLALPPIPHTPHLL